MNSIRILIIEDEFIIVEDLKIQLRKLGYQINGVAKSYEKALQLIEEDEPDLMLVDIKLKGEKDGIHLAETVRQEYDIPFIFLTSHADPKTVERAKKVNPNGYLTKPFERDDLYTSIEIAFNNYIKTKTGTQAVNNFEDENGAILNDSIFVKKDHLLIKIRFEELEWIKADRNYLELHCGGRYHLIRSTLQDFLNKIPRQHFIQVHRSYAININHITAIDFRDVVIVKEKIPIGRSFYEPLKEKLKIFK